MRRSWINACLLVLSCLALPGQEYDLILRNGTVIDGSGSKGFRGDVGIRGGYIQKTGDLRGEKAKVEIDVKGLVVAPGFINLHSHATPVGVSHAVNMLSQGVTTEIINADGYGTRSIAKQLQEFAAKGLAVNLGAYGGFNYAWGSVMGMVDRRPTQDEIQRMRDVLVANLEEGAWGISAGLDYKPGYFATTAEAIAILQPAGSWRTNFPNHDRLRPELGFSSLAAIAETIEIAKKAGLLPVITHMKVQGHEQGKADKAIELLRKGGAAADIYPYLAGQTGLGALFVPGWALAGGRDAMLERFANPAQRAKIASEIEQALIARVLTPENVDIPSRKKKLTDYMREMNAGAGETIIRILEKEHPSAILQFGAEADLVKLLQYRDAAVSCDCGASDDVPGMHPRYYGTFPRVLGHYVRETKALELEDAVRKMSGLPASIIGMADRGFIAPGMAADIAVFDPAKVIDHATYADPTRPSTGVVHVLVNGVIAWRDGKAAPGPAQGGKILRRTAADPPSRTTMNATR